MSAQLRIMVGDYLRVRRSLGYRLVGTEHLLFALVDYLDDRGAPTLTVEHAVRFATAPSQASARRHALRLSAIRCFTRWAHTLDPDDIDVHALRRQGWTITAIARHLGRDRKTIRACLAGDRVAGVRARTVAGPFEVFAPYCAQRLADDPHLWASTLFDELARPRERRDHPDLPPCGPRHERESPRQNKAHRSPPRALQDQKRHTSPLPGVPVIMPTSQPPTGL